MYNVFLNHFYQLNAVFNSYGFLLDLIVCNNPSLEVQHSLKPVIPADKYHPVLNIKLPNCQSALSCIPDQTYFNFGKADNSKICSFILSSFN